MAARYPFARPLAAPPRIDPRWTIGIALAVAISAGPIAGASVALCLAALAAALRREHAAMLLLYCIALRLDAQALLIAPLLVGLLLNRRSGPFRPLVLPALAAGMMSVWRLCTVVAAAPLDALTGGGPCLWSIADLFPVDVPLIGLALATVIGTTALFIAHLSACTLGDRALLSAAALSSLVIATLLPGAAIGCFILPLAIIVARASCDGNRQGWHVVALVGLGVAMALLAAPVLGAMAIGAAIVLLGGPLFKPAANDNPILARTV